MAKSETTSVNRKSVIVTAAIKALAEIGCFRATTAQ